MCVRRERGYCSIGWTPSNHPDSFKVRGITMMMIHMWSGGVRAVTV